MSNNGNNNNDASHLDLADLARGDTVRVEYNSAYSDKRQSFEGVVTSAGGVFGRVSIDPEEDMADGEPRIYEVTHFGVSVDTGYGSRRISQDGMADLHIERLDAVEDEEMGEFESAQALIHADEGDVITLSYDSVNDAHGRQEKRVEVIEAPYRYDYEDEDYDAAEVMAKDTERDEGTEHVYVRLYAYTDDTDGYVATGYEGHAETRSELDTIGAIRRLGVDLRVSNVESRVIAAGCIGCGFGYDHTEHDRCPVCFPADDEDEDEDEPEPTIVTDGGVDAEEEDEETVSLSRAEAAKLRKGETLTLDYTTTQETHKRLQATVDHAESGVYYAFVFLSVEGGKPRTLHVYQKGGGTLYTHHDAAGGGRQLSKVGSATLCQPASEFEHNRQWSAIVNTEEPPKPLAEGEHIETDSGVTFHRLEGVNSGEFVVSAGTSNVFMDREEIGILAELVGFEVTER